MGFKSAGKRSEWKYLSVFTALLETTLTIKRKKTENTQPETLGGRDYLDVLGCSGRLKKNLFLTATIYWQAGENDSCGLETNNLKWNSKNTKAQKQARGQTGVQKGAYLYTIKVMLNTGDPFFCPLIYQVSTPTVRPVEKLCSLERTIHLQWQVLWKN